MEEPKFFERLFVWFPGLLLTVSLLALFIYNDSQITWLADLAKMSCGFFWLMPALYLWIRPNLLIHFVNLLWVGRPSSKFFVTGLEQNTWIEKNHLKQLSDQELSIVYLTVFIGIIIGVYIFLNLLGIVPP